MLQYILDAHRGKHPGAKHIGECQRSRKRAIIIDIYTSRKARIFAFFVWVWSAGDGGTI